MSQSIKRTIARAFCTAFVFAVPGTLSALTIDLKPAFEFPTTYQGREVIAVGRDGLYLDSRTTAPAAWQGSPTPEVAFATWANPANNFTWLDVTLEINDITGNGVISGTMKNNANANDIYSLTMNLSGMCIRNGGSCTARSAAPTVDLRTFLESPANARNSNLGEGLNTGLEWTNVALTVTNLAGGPTPVYTGVSDYTGWAMGHVNPVELLIWSNSPGPGQLYFAAWYQAFNQLGQRTAVGDTKSFGVLQPDVPVNPVPEPGSMMLLATAGLGLLHRKRKQS